MLRVAAFTRAVDVAGRASYTRSYGAVHALPHPCDKPVARDSSSSGHDEIALWYLRPMTGGVRAHFRGLDDRQLMLQYIQPGLVGLIDGTLSTLAPIFAAALLAGSHAALFVGLATAVGAGISMGLSEGLSDDGTHTGRGSAPIRGLVTGLMTTLGGSLHSLPFLIEDVHTALIVAVIVVAIELLVISWIRKRFLFVSLRLSFLQVAFGGIVIVAVGLAFGAA